MRIIYISSQLLHFCGDTARLYGLIFAKNSEILSKMATEGLENTIRVKVIESKCGADASNDDYIHFFLFILFFLEMQPSFLSREWPATLPRLI